MVLYEVLASQAASKYFFFFSGLGLALLLIELRLNLRILFQRHDDLKYRVIIPVMIAPDWALNTSASKKLATCSKTFLSLFKK